MTSTTEAAHKAGASFRQVDYWLRQGFVPGVKASTGTGVPRELTPSQVKFIGMMGSLVTAGMKPQEASELVKKLLKDREVRLGTWIKVSVV